MPNPIFLTLGPITIRWYGLTAAVAFAASFLYIKKFLPTLLGKSALKNIQAHLEKLLFPLVIAGLIGARLYHVLNELPFYLKHPALIPAIWHGGLAIHGGLIAGALYLWYYTKKQRVSFLIFADILMPALLLGQAIGRWGNFFNQELFGAPTSLPWGIFIDQANRPLGFEQFTHFHPAFLYEFIWNILIVVGITLWIRRKPQKPGAIFGIALALSGMGRFLIEFIRIDTVPIIFGARLPLITSAFVLLAGLCVLAYTKNRATSL
jgi:phosphatidylglycerol:prolipoprotein diacylglycerol transferase